jgi:peptide-methionine (S)-S-oxide reductase
VLRRCADPTTSDRQGNDRGTQYRSAIFFHSPEQKEVAERVLKEVEANPKAMKTYEGKKIVTQIAPASKFYKAEDYHQLYLDANPGGYCNHKVKW